MPGVFVNLPCPAANGNGAWVDCSALGAERTIVVGKSTATELVASITIEVSNEAVPTSGAPIKTFEGTGTLSLPVAARFMRCSVDAYKRGVPQVDVGGFDNGCDFVNLAAPVGNGVGAGADVSTLGPLKTVTVGGTFTGAVLIEASEDGGSTWGQVLPQFTQRTGGVQTATFMAEFMRVRRTGAKASAGTPIVNVGADIPGSGGGGLTNPQLFRYTADGTEGDSFTVPLPAARANADYFVFVLQSDYPIAAKVPNTRRQVGDRTVNDFLFQISSPADEGDEWEFLVAGG